MPMEIRDSLNKKLDGVRARTALDKALTKAINDLKDRAVIEAPIKTGNLRRSHSVEIRRSSEMVEGLLKNSANYWQYVEFGTSRQDANDFLGRALLKVQPEKRVAKYFKEFYKQ